MLAFGRPESRVISPNANISLLSIKVSAQTTAAAMYNAYSMSNNMYCTADPATK